MAWQLKHPTHRRFKRNPLHVVTAQLKFHPILKVKEKVPDFQEKVRREFPIFTEAATRTVQIKENQAQVEDEPQFQFSKHDEPSVVGLTKDAVIFATHQHRDRDTFQARMEIAVRALTDLYSPIIPVRLGLRYVNEVERELISKDLGEDVKWEDLINPPFLRVPSDLADLDKTTFFLCEVQSGLPEGRLTVRYGLLANPNGGKIHFRLDMDRFVEGDFDIATVKPKLGQFADDMHAVFLTAAGPTLLRWMGDA